MVMADITPLVLFTPDIEIQGVDEKLKALVAKLSGVIESGVASVGPPSAYALVWEWGNVRQHKEGPKTVLSTNPKGEKAFLTIQAPHGWIAINEPAMWDAVFDEINKLDFDDLDESNVEQELKAFSQRVSERILMLLQATVPIDSGALYDSLEIIAPGSELQELAAEIAGSDPEDLGILVL